VQLMLDVTTFILALIFMVCSSASGRSFNLLSVEMQ
jgi:hypothetical protein